MEIPTSHHVKVFRKRVGLSVRGLANSVGVTPLTIVQIENYDLCPTDELKDKIASALNVTKALIFPESKPQAERVALPLTLG